MRLRWPWIVLTACGPAAVTPPSTPSPATSASAASEATSATPAHVASSSAAPADGPPPTPTSTSPDVSIAPWTPKDAVTGTLALGKPLTAHGVSLVLTRFSHKEAASGAVVGIWEWELRKGGAKVEGGATEEALLAETSGFGVIALLRADGGDVQATLAPSTQTPFTDQEAHDFAVAEHKRRNLPKGGGSGTIAGTTAGIYAMTWNGKPRVRITIGLHSRRVLAVTISGS